MLSWTVCDISLHPPRRIAFAYTVLDAPLQLQQAIGSVNIRG